MKYCIPTRPQRVRPPRPRSRVPGHMRATHPSSLNPFTLSPRDFGLTTSTPVLARRQPFHFSLYPTAGPLNPIQNHNLPASAANTGGSVQVAVSKARRAASLPLRRLLPPPRFRYSTKTSQAECCVGVIPAPPQVICCESSRKIGLSQNWDYATTTPSRNMLRPTAVWMTRNKGQTRCHTNWR